jgi:hypothetical protein
MDAFTIYREWWRDHYGYECPITREAWQRWCAQPRVVEFVSDFDFDRETERREGWTK